MILPTKARPSLSYSQSLPSGSKNYNLQSPGKQTNNNNKKTQSQEATPNDHMDHSLVQLKEAMSHVMQGHPRWTGHGGKFWQNMAYRRREWQTPSVFLTQETHEQFSSVQFSHSVVSDSLWPHELQHVRTPCPSPTPRIHSDSCPSSQWCHPAISSSVVPFSSCSQPLPASESFPRSQLFLWGGLSTGVSALVSSLPKKSQGSSSSEWTGWISLQSQGLSKVFSNTTVQKHQFFDAQETHEQYEKAKRYDTRRWVPQGGKCPICHWGRVEKQFQKEWRSWTNAKMSLSRGVCLVVKVKSNAVKNSHV